MEIPDNERKAIYAVRQKRREEKNNPPPQETDPEKIRKEKLVDGIMRKVCPSYYELQKIREEAAYSEWFALSELKRVKNHIDEVHHGDASKCHDGCLEDFTMEDGKAYASIIYNAVKDYE